LKRPSGPANEPDSIFRFAFSATVREFRVDRRARRSSTGVDVRVFSFMVCLLASPSQRSNGPRLQPGTFSDHYRRRTPKQRFPLAASVVLVYKPLLVMVAVVPSNLVIVILNGSL